jgi:hypothetical protein
MSVILDALQKARREAAAEEHGASSYTILDSPAAAARIKTRRLILFLSLFSILCMLCVLVLGWSYISPRLQWNGKPIGSLLARGQAANANSAMANQQMRNLPAPAGQAPLSTGSSDSVSSSWSTSRQAAVQTADDLPAPVPLTELGPEAADALPPAPIAARKPGDASPEHRSAAPQQAMSVSAAEAGSASRNRGRSGPGGFTLGSILYDSSDPMAVVNGINVHEGQAYSDFKVLRIKPNEVIVQRDGEKPVTLRMN